MTDPHLQPGSLETKPQTQSLATKWHSHWKWGAGLAAVLLLGLGTAGSFAQNWYPFDALQRQPGPIANLAEGWVVAVKGQVAEIFGNKFIIQDDSGRALVELGPRGEGGNVVRKGEPLTVQGRFENGFIHAQIVTYADGRSFAFGPPRPHPKKGPGKKGPRPDDGPDDRAYGPGPIPLPGPTAQAPGQVPPPPPPPAGSPPPPAANVPPQPPR